MSNTTIPLLNPNQQTLLPSPSRLVRESTAQLIREQRRAWAYSTPIVIIDLIWNTLLICTAIVVIIVSESEIAEVPIRAWLIGYVIQCVVHMFCVCLEFRHRREMSGDRVRSLVSSSGSGSDTSSSSGSGSSSESNLVRQDEDNTRSCSSVICFGSVAKHLESASRPFAFIWWIIGFYWISSGGQTLADDAPKLFCLTRIFLAFDVLFVVICVVVACIIGIGVCCCLPCIIAILYAMPNEQGASREVIERLPNYRFRRSGEAERRSGEIQELFVGVMIECGTDTPTELALSEDRAECSICISEYEDESELRELPCHHHFHCACVDRWLRMNPTCPICKYNILTDGNQSRAEV